jgi:hypothetical protein
MLQEALLMRSSILPAPAATISFCQHQATAALTWPGAPLADGICLDFKDLPAGLRGAKPI